MAGSGFVCQFEGILYGIKFKTQVQVQRLLVKFKNNM